MYNNDFAVEQIKTSKGKIDISLLSVFLILVMTGISMLWSASWFRAEQLYGSPMRFFLRQSIWVLLSTIAMLISMFISLEKIRRILPFLLLITLVLLSLTFVPVIGARYLGARRWILLFNVSFQPSEVAKVVLILYLTHFFTLRDGNFSNPWKSLLPPVIVVALFAGIVLLQNDFSTAVFLLFVACVMFFVGGVPISHFLRVAVLFVPIALIMLFTHEHRVRRIISFLVPSYDPDGSSFQVLAAHRALEAGGLWGIGIGKGLRKRGGLPEAQADFIFAVVAEELGFIGVCLIIVLFAFVAARSFYCAYKEEDRFRSLLIVGIAFSITLQVILNIAVVVGAVPATGIPLPFFSAGGSSLLATFVMFGLLFNATRCSSEYSKRTYG